MLSLRSSHTVSFLIEFTLAQRGPQLRVSDVIRERALGRPDAVALRHGERAITYAELGDRSNRLAQALAAAGVGTAISRLCARSPTAPRRSRRLSSRPRCGRFAAGSSACTG